MRPSANSADGEPVDGVTRPADFQFGTWDLETRTLDTTRRPEQSQPGHRRARERADGRRREQALAGVPLRGCSGSRRLRVREHRHGLSRLRGVVRGRRVRPAGRDRQLRALERRRLRHRLLRDDREPAEPVHRSSGRDRGTRIAGHVSRVPSTRQPERLLDRLRRRQPVDRHSEAAGHRRQRQTRTTAGGRRGLPRQRQKDAAAINDIGATGSTAQGGVEPHAAGQTGTAIRRLAGERPDRLVGREAARGRMPGTARTAPAALPVKIMGAVCFEIREVIAPSAIRDPSGSRAASCVPNSHRCATSARSSMSTAATPRGGAAGPGGCNFGFRADRVVLVQ